MSPRIDDLIVPLLCVLSALFVLAGCADAPQDDADGSDPETVVAAATIGPEGGVLSGEQGTRFECVSLTIAAGALEAPTQIRISETVDDTALPEGAFAVGAQFAIEPGFMPLNAPARLSVPFSSDRVAEFGQAPASVKVWTRQVTGWSLRQQVDVSDECVTVEVNELATAGAGVKTED